MSCSHSRELERVNRNWKILYTKRKFNDIMSQTINSEKKLWVLVSSIKENSKANEFEQIVPKVRSLVDEWNSEGKFVWSGPLDNEKSAMAIFEATDQEAKHMFEQNKNATANVLDSYLYHWDALPFLSLLN